MRELEKLLKDLDLVIAKIKDIDRKVKAKVKSAVLTGDKIDKVSAKVKSSILTGDKIDKVSAKALISKMLDTPEQTIERLLNIQKTVAKGCQDTRSTAGLQQVMEELKWVLAWPAR
ncbi:hypothetical protein DSO57_1034403 [Entomophthora muscae]|uniref:Uncharacterized protein n=1 Tax=Entomophthora muscae TaxID=34485 RepID=A0ACC2TYG0_9FUNG|nr:hypothetical protein DSO57_1034403 [Entomophthora muscae]